MPLKPTVFIVGAGASNDVGLPIGSGLRDKIADKLNFDFEDGIEWRSGDKAIVAAIKTLTSQNNRRDMSSYLNSGLAISRAMKSNLAPSIDTFIDHHNEDADLVAVGKMAIASSILEAEQTSTLRIPQYKDGPVIAGVKDTWYPSFLNLIGTSVKASNLEAIFSSVTIVCFNYDRCIEHYLYHAIQDKFRRSENEAQSLMERLKIFHPYGTVGRLPWQKGDGIAVNFGASPTGSNVLSSSKEIRTFTEQWEDKNALKEIKVSIWSADAIIFLGFGFIPQNMQLLKTLQESKANDVFLTAKGISETDRVHVKNAIRRTFFDGGNTDHPRFHTVETCNGMFSDHYHALLPFLMT